MAPPLIVRAILDAQQYFKVSEGVVSSNTAMGESALGMSGQFVKGADATVAAGVRVIQSQRAQLAQLQALSAAAVAGSDERIAADVAVARAQTALNRSMGISVVATSKVGQEAKTAERDMGKFTRGALAGSGVFSKLGRSLAFASSGFIAIAVGSTAIAASVRQAESLAAAQRKVDQQLKVSNKSWAEYGDRIDSALLKEGHLAGFTRTDLLGAFAFLLRVGGNVSNSLNLVGLAADVARGRNISLQAASIALSKALGGSATALRRLGIIVPNNVTKMAALEYVQKKFAGQAAVGTTQSQRFGAALADAGATAGTVLLPTFERLSKSASNWLNRMQQSGKLTKDVSSVTNALGTAFHDLGAIIGTVDDITGGFGNTLLLIGEIWAGIKVASWIGTLRALAIEWGIVGSAATKAATAQGAAATASGVASGVAGGGAGLIGVGAVGRFGAMRSGAAGLTFASKAGQLTTVASQAESKIPIAIGAFKGMAAALEGMAPIAAAIIALQIIQSKTYKDLRDEIRKAAGGNDSFFGQIVHDLTMNLTEVPGEVKGSFEHMVHTWEGFLGLLKEKNLDIARLIEQERQRLGLTRLDRLFPVPQGPPSMTSAYGRPARQSFEVPLYLQIAQAQAGFTASVKDDVDVARRIIKNIKRIIDRGNYTQKGLLDLLQAEAAALGVIQQAQNAAKAKAAARKAAALAAASTFEIPGYLQLAQAKAEAYGKSETAILKKIIAAAQKAINAGGKNWQGLVAAYQVIAQARQALEQAAQAAIIPLKLQLALAKAQATGADQTPILKKMKAALEKALKAAKGNIQRQIDIWNQIAQINQQLGANVSNAYGDYKKASLKWETQGLGLTRSQREALQARLSQIGPGHTHPMSGTGAAGYTIDPETGRPLHRGHRRRGSQYGSSVSNTPTVQANIDLHVYIDGHQVEATVTKRQQKNNTRRPTQRRGPNAATR